jgi:hypothetical protein
MGEKRTSVRTLPSGEKVTHNPDGSMYLIRDRSPLRERLAGKRDHKRHRHALIHQVHRQRIEFKQLRQSRKGLSSEKSPI